MARRCNASASRRFCWCRLDSYVCGYLRRIPGRFRRQSDQEITHSGNRRAVIDCYMPQGISRHIRDGGVSRILHDCDASAAFDRVQAGRAVAQRSREYDPYHPRPVTAGGGAKQRVDCRPRQVLSGAPPQQHVPVVQQHVRPGRRHQDAPLLDAFATFGLRNRQRTGPIEDAGKWLAAPTCSTTKIAAGRSGGRSRANRVSASTPPAEAPITMMSCFGALPLIERS
jgi:hypothetical protein